MKNFSFKVFAMALIIFPLLVFNSCKSDQTSQDFTADVSTVTSKPNIVFFLIDDIGVISTPAYSANMDGSPVVSATQDTGYVQNGGSFYPYTTSNINRLASESLVFTKMYATPLCAPSRGQLMTGLYPFQTGIVYPAFPNRGPQWDFGPASPETPGSGYLNPDFTTYPKMLRDDGDYYTGFGGKWNLRWGVPNSTADHEPFYDSLVIKQAEHLNDCGFTNIYNPDAYTALIGNTVDYYPPQLSKDRANNEDYFPYSLNAWALDFLDDAKSKLQNDNTPYYLHYCAGLIHDDDYLAIPGYPSPPASEEVHFANKIHVVDSLIGVVIDKVKNDPILSQNTIIIVAGDNGTEPTYTTKYRGNPTVGGKFSTKTYGSNVPFIVNWPDTLAPGTYTQLADFADVHSTMTNLAGIDGSSVYTSGVSFLHNMKLPPSSRSELRSYIYSQANGLNQNPNVPSCPGSLAQDAFIANQEYSLIPSSCGGALFKINPTTLQDSFLCTNGCTETDYEDAYCTLYTELITLAPPTEFVPYDNTYKCSEG